MFAKRAWIRHSVPLVHEMRNDLREIGAPDKDDRMIRIEFDSIVEPIGRLVETGAGPTSPHHLRRVRGSLGCELLLASDGRALVGPAEGSGDRPRVAVFGSLTVGTGGVAAADGRSSTSCDRRRPTSFSRGPRGLYPTHRARVACRRDEVHWRQLPRSGDAGAAVIGCCSSLGPPLTHEGCPEEGAPRARRDRSRAEGRTKGRAKDISRRQLAIPDDGRVHARPRHGGPDQGCEGGRGVLHCAGQCQGPVGGRGRRRPRRSAGAPRRADLLAPPYGYTLRATGEPAINVYATADDPSDIESIPGPDAAREVRSTAARRPTG